MANQDGDLELCHGLEAILKDADVKEWPPSVKLYDQLCDGIFLNKQTKKYWFDRKTSSNCFIFYPGALKISWIENSSYWRWNFLEESCNTIKVAELLNVSWLDIRGKIKTSELSPRTLYEAVFVVMMKDPAYGWEIPVNVKLRKPNGSKQERKENLQERPKGQWFEIPVGDFTVNDCDCGEIEFRLYEHGGHWKKGLQLKCVVIRAKGSSC